ncbi:hypothetical protein ZEAMMB73_Zm00001d004014 [Zea mays]|uniref:Uncharacterized protein n=1 Tax=Zea mays TaxID=4577 RepID=A0A1D6ECY8_MAIZE|nr:hypothetical protein ZEAMMB73_Zm00001d004014 [Zea mays]
MILNSGAPLG